jgi:hypothetical protein
MRTCEVGNVMGSNRNNGLTIVLLGVTFLLLAVQIGVIVFFRGCFVHSDGVLVARELRIVDEQGRVRILGRVKGEESSLALYRAEGQESILLYVHEGGDEYGALRYPEVVRTMAPRIAIGVDSEGGGWVTSRGQRDVISALRIGMFGDGSMRMYRVDMHRDELMSLPAYNPTLEFELARIALGGVWFGIGADGRVLLDEKLDEALGLEPK